MGTRACIAILLASLAACGDDSVTVDGSIDSPAAIDLATADAGPQSWSRADASVCDDEHWCWVSPRPQGNDLKSVWFASRSDGWAVGDGGTLLRWDGASWTGRAAIVPAGLRAVWGSGPSDVWAVGGLGTAMHWDGLKWTTVPTGTMDTLTSLWGRAPSDVWAGGTGGVHHWDGQQWSLAGIAPTAVVAIAGTAQGDVWAVGSGLILHWDGAQWRSPAWPAATGEEVDFTGVWTSPSGAAWILGNEIDCCGGGIYLFRSDGADLKDASDARLQSVNTTAIWGTSDSDVWLAGLGEVHWDGGAWTHVADLSATALAGTAMNDAWLVGPLGSMGRWDGARWVGGDPGSGTPLYSIVDAWALSERDLYATSNGDVWHWDGAYWTKVNSAGTSGLRALWGAATDDVWAVGQDGAIVRFDGKAWSVEPSGTDAFLARVSGSGADDVWAVGEKGVALHRTGGAWSPVATGTTDRLSAVWVAAPGDVWVAAAPDKGLAYALHGDGKTWSARMPLAQSAPSRVWGTGAGDVWIVDGMTSSPVEHWDGHAWSELAAPSGTAVLGVGGLHASDVWFAGFDKDGGVTLRWDGHALAPAATRAPDALRVVLPVGNSLVAVGSYGALLNKVQ